MACSVRSGLGLGALGPGRPEAPRAPGPRPKAGFTLLEVILATVIFTLVVAAAYGLLHASQSLAERAEFRAQLRQEARIVLDVVRADLEGAYGSDTVFDTGLLGTQGGGDDTPLYKLDLVSVNHATFRSTTAESDITRTSYYIDEEPGTEPTGLVRRKQKQLTNVTTVLREDEGLEEIGPRVAYVMFRYYDGTEWTEVWDSTRSGKLPKAIEVTIHVKGTWEGEEVLEKYVEKIYLPIAAERPEKKQ